MKSKGKNKENSKVKIFRAGYGSVVSGRIPDPYQSLKKEKNPKYWL